MSRMIFDDDDDDDVRSMCLFTGNHIPLPSGKRLHNELENHHVEWENPLFLWVISIASCQSLPEGKSHENIPLNHSKMPLNHYKSQIYPRYIMIFFMILY